MRIKRDAEIHRLGGGECAAISTATQGSLKRSEREEKGERTTHMVQQVNEGCRRAGDEVAPTLAMAAGGSGRMASGKGSNIERGRRGERG